MSEENKQRLQEYQKNYCEAKNTMQCGIELIIYSKKNLIVNQYLMINK